MAVQPQPRRRRGTPFAVIVRMKRDDPGKAVVDAVQRELARDAATTDLVLDVSADGRVVTLRGRVPNLTDTDNALAVAGRVPGVDDVVDEIEVDES